MDLSIIIPTCNRNSILYSTIKNTINIADKFTTNYEIIVVNDGDSEIGQISERTIIVRNKKRGVASARNYGVHLSQYRNLLFLDDDVLLTDEAFNRIIAFLQNEDNKKVLNVSWVFPSELIEKIKKTSFGRFLIKIKYTEMKGWMGDIGWKENDEYPVENLASYCLAIKKETFEATGGYNEVFPYAGFEDYEFSCRAKNIGVISLLNTKVKVWHNESDRVAPRGWFARRYREGITRAVYVKEIGTQEYIINPGRFKKITYGLIKNMIPFLVFITGLANRFPFLDFLTYPVFKAITGAELYAGYSGYEEKD